MSDSDGKQNSPHDLAQALSEVARTLSSEQGLDETLTAITAASVDTVPGADYAGITLVTDRRQVESVAPTDDLVARSDEAQQNFGEGPCLEAVYEHHTVQVDNMATEQRWPRFAKFAVQEGALSMLSFQLFTDHRNLGALNLYSQKQNAFAGNDAEHIGTLFAAHAAIALRGAQQERHLTEALQNRDVIGQAKGILVERHKITSDEAFQLLVRTSQNNHVKLHNVADYLVRTGNEAGQQQP